MARPFLIICRAGNNSLHKEWVQDTQRHFDLYLSYYGDEQGKYAADADYYDETKGPKWPILHQILEQNPAFLDKYSAIWFPDDDISMPTEQINRMFNLFCGMGMDLAQPALTLDSHVSHKELIQEQNSVLRLVNFIEVMAPIFSKKAINQLYPTFAQSKSGWGLDFLWPVLLGQKNMAILDATPMTHTRPLGGDLYKNNPSLSPRNDIELLKTLYPQLNLSKNHKPNKFRIFSTLRIKLRHHSFARIAARLTRRKNLKEYNRSKRFDENK